MVSDADMAGVLRELRDTLGPDHPATQAALSARLTEVLLREQSDPEPGLWWTSFASADRPEGDQFLGVVVVEAIGPVHAQQRISELGINPGGEARMWGPFPPEAIPAGWRDRLLSRAEAEQAEAGDG